MFSKKVLLSSLAVLIVAGGAYFYGSGASFMGKFTTSNPVQTTKVTDSPTTKISSLPMITLSYTTNTDGTFARKSVPTASVSLGNFSIKLGKSAADLKSCDVSLGAYNDGSMHDAVYDSSVDPNPSFVKSVTMNLSHNGGYAETLAPTDVVYSNFQTDFTSLLAAFAPTSSSTYKYTINSYVDTNSKLGVEAGDTANYEANTGYIYLTGLSCYFSSSTTGATRVIFDPSLTTQDSNLSLSSYDKGKGILLTHVVVGN